jgi:lipopolysaccharide transport system permease protein
VPIDLRELWQFHDLLYYLVWRDVKARYRQTFFGATWAILRPLLTMVVFAAVFGGLAGLTSGSDVPYPLFLYAGLVPWVYLQSVATSGPLALLNNRDLVSKAYFPRLFTPLATVSAPLVDLGFSLIVLMGLFAWYRWTPSWHMIFLPLFLALAVLTGLTIALWLSGTAVRYRDVGYALPFAAQIWMYLTPVIYPVSLVPERFRWLLALNPATTVVGGSRWALLGGSLPKPGVLAAGTVLILVLFTCGLFVLRRAERTIVDMI